jgi:hypothetical protein
VRRAPTEGPYRYLVFDDPIDAIETYLVKKGDGATREEIIDELLDGAAITDCSYNEAVGDIKRCITANMNRPSKAKKGQPLPPPRLIERDGKIYLGKGAHLEGK